jgi:hypothetical protein
VKVVLVPCSGRRKKKGAEKGRRRRWCLLLYQCGRKAAEGGEGEPCGGKEDRGPGTAVEWHCRPATARGQRAVLLRARSTLKTGKGGSPTSGPRGTVIGGGGLNWI